MNFRPSFEEGAVEAAFGEDLGSHTSAGAGADDTDVVLLGRTNYLGHFEFSVLILSFRFLALSKKKELLIAQCTFFSEPF
jgi:hypothetical protein